MSDTKKIYITPCTDDKYVYPYIVSVGEPINTVDHPHYLDEDVEPAVSRTDGHKIAARLMEKYGPLEIVDKYLPVEKAEE
jgi:hypothetical protein